MVDPVVRAKLADWLAVNCPSYRGDETFDYLATALLGLPPSVRAQLVGIDVPDVEISQPLPPGRFATSNGVHLMADADLKITTADRVLTGKIRAGTLTQRTIPAPVGVAGRNQPNPKEVE